MRVRIKVKVKVKMNVKERQKEKSKLPSRLYAEVDGEDLLWGDVELYCQATGT